MIPAEATPVPTAVTAADTSPQNFQIKFRL
jgi:hypothetical protein